MCLLYFFPTFRYLVQKADFDEAYRQLTHLLAVRYSAKEKHEYAAFREILDYPIFSTWQSFFFFFCHFT